MMRLLRLRAFTFSSRANDKAHSGLASHIEAHVLEHQLARRRMADALYGRRLVHHVVAWPLDPELGTCLRQHSDQPLEIGIARIARAVGSEHSHRQGRQFAPIRQKLPVSLVGKRHVDDVFVLHGSESCYGVTPMLYRRMPGCATKSCAERSFRFIAHREANTSNALACVVQPVRSEPHSPVRKIIQRGLSHYVAKMLGESSARHSGDARQFDQCPTPGRIVVHCVDGARQAWVRQGSKPAGMLARSEPEPQNLKKHDLRKMIGHQSTARRALSQFCRQLFQGPSQNCGLARCITNMNDGWQSVEQQPRMVSLKKEAPTDQEKISTTVADCDPISCAVVDRRGIYRWKPQIGSEQERTAARQQETVSGLDLHRLGFAFYRDPTGTLYDGVELDPLVRRELDSPFSTGIEASTDRGLGLEQRENIGQRVHSENPYYRENKPNYTVWIVRLLWPIYPKCTCLSDLRLAAANFGEQE